MAKAPEYSLRKTDLKEKGMRSVLMLPLGYRDSEDWLAPMKKVRNPMKDFATKLYE